MKYVTNFIQQPRFIITIPFSTATALLESQSKIKSY